MFSVRPVAWRIACVAVIATFAQHIYGAVESRFTLAPESRVPVWLNIPAGMTRSDVSVVLTYFTPTPEGADAALELRDKNGRLIQSVAVRSCWHPITQKKRNRYGGFEADAYPLYQYLKKDGKVEVVEHRRMEPIFHVSDDAQLKDEAAHANRCD